ncbi:cation transporter, partial [Enterococcus hirae]
TEVLVAAKIDIFDHPENESYAIINNIEETIRQSLNDKKVYIYIETDKYDPNYRR